MVRTIGWVALVGVLGCGGSSKGGGSSDKDAWTLGSDGSGTPYGTSTEGDADTDSDADTDAGEQTDTDAPEPDTLTAGVWDDNVNFGLFQDWLAGLTLLADMPGLTVEEQVSANADFPAERESRARLDVAFLLDTTGSMADEHQWLVREFGTVADRIQEASPNVDIRWALVVYRDFGDTYVSESFPFTGDVDAFQNAIADQFASGGGDWPEAVQEGLRDTLDLDWREDADVARVAFWIADAPAHAEDVATVEGQLREARTRDVHLYPVAASGTTPSMEVTMRVAAQLTGGRYLFLTDDSGVGNSHAEPMIPCYFVTLLSDAVVRVVDIELTGVYREPDPAEVLRTGGDPQDGACILESGQEAWAF